jgi:hypothetical protein
MPPELLPPCLWRSGGKSASKDIETIEQRPCRQHVAVELDGVDRERLAEDLEETLPVGVVLIDVFPFIAPAGDVVEGAGILGAKKSGHGPFWQEGGDLSTMEI